MTELARSARKMTHADRFPSLGGKISEMIWRQTDQILERFTKNLQQRTTKKQLNLLNHNFEKIKWTGKNKQDNLSRPITN